MSGFEQEYTSRPPALFRFLEGWVFTRILGLPLHKANWSWHCDGCPAFLCCVTIGYDCARQHYLLKADRLRLQAQRRGVRVPLIALE